MPRELHNYRMIDSRLPHVGVEDMVQIVKPEADHSYLTTGIAKSLLDLRGFPLYVKTRL
jgi:hypothetical protein